MPGGVTGHRLKLSLLLPGWEAVFSKLCRNVWRQLVEMSSRCAASGAGNAFDVRSLILMRLLMFGIVQEPKSCHLALLPFLQ